MKQSLNFVTIGVANLEKAKNFYIDKFGWKPFKDDDGIVFFQLNGFIFALFPEDELADDIGIVNDGSGFRRMTFAINCRSEEEVNQMFSELEKNGVKIVKPPAKVFWGGYSGYIADAEDNYWEIAFNPFLKL